MLRALRTGPRRFGKREWYIAMRRVWAPSTSSTKVMSARLRPTCGLAAAMFSTFDRDHLVIADACRRSAGQSPWETRLAYWPKRASVSAR